jgi:cytochrome c oxidase subunit IV
MIVIAILDVTCSQVPESYEDVTTLELYIYVASIKFIHSEAAYWVAYTNLRSHHLSCDRWSLSLGPAMIRVLHVEDLAGFRMVVEQDWDSCSTLN